LALSRAIDAMTAYAQFAVIRARFEPKRRDNLRPAAVASIGLETTWRAMYVMDEGEYEGQMAFITQDPAINVGGWVPECDLVPVGWS